MDQGIKIADCKGKEGNKRKKAGIKKKPKSRESMTLLER